MDKKRRLSIIILLCFVLGVPAQALVQARPNQKSVGITINNVVVDDLDADGFKEDARIQGAVAFTSFNLQSNQRCIIFFYLTYIVDGSYVGEMSQGTTWRFYKTFSFTTISQSSKPFTYEIINLPYPGWYSVRAAVFVDGRLAVSNSFIFDPPGSGGPGPIGR
jgi:hypothetical protein